MLQSTEHTRNNIAELHLKLINSQDSEANMVLRKLIPVLLALLQRIDELQAEVIGLQKRLSM